MKAAIVVHNKDLMYGFEGFAMNGAAISPNISFNSYYSILMESVMTICAGTKECHIALKSADGVTTYGDVVVDMDNNMKILRVTPTNPTAYSVVQVGTNNVEVSYNR